MKEKVSGKKAKINWAKGLDVGTSFIQCAENRGKNVSFRSLRNAFFDMEHTDFTKRMLNRTGVDYIQKDEKLYVIGGKALEFANIFNKEARRPLRGGAISPKEKEALPLIEVIIKSVLGRSERKGAPISFSVPGDPIDAELNLTYHENVLNETLSKLGYTPKPINEALAVILSELDDKNFTGIGISFGGGMVNVCLSFMATPVFSFSLSKSGDWIDAQTASAVDETNSKVCSFKEKSLDLTKTEGLSRTEKALSVYYRNLMEYVLKHLKRKFENTKEMPDLKEPIDIVIAGGTSLPKGFLQQFNQMLKKIDLPQAIGNVKMAGDPMSAVANGALISAIADENKG